MQAKIRSFLFFFSVLLMKFQFNSAAAQSLQLDTSSQKEYRFSIKKVAGTTLLTASLGFYWIISRMKV
ncbi:MAG: hypothetical protein K0S31_573 [Sphingobacterium multivorum]|nr:hypothetical protein [Sphingobacterium multivorum]